MTNADKIRAMSDEELAVLINACDNYDCYDCPYNTETKSESVYCIRNSGFKNDDGTINNKDALKWLKQEVD